MNLLASSQAIGVTKFRHSLKTVARLTHVRGAHLVDSQPLTSVASPIGTSWKITAYQNSYC